MKFIITAFFFFSAFCMQQKTLMNNFEKPNSNIGIHSHSDDSLAFNELLEIIFTGHINHVHEHNDHDEDSAHSHPHEHISPKFASLVDFLPVAFTFNLDKLKTLWPNDPQRNSAKAFQSEILRPPIA